MCFACILTEDIMKGLLAQKLFFFFFILTGVVSLIKGIVYATQHVGCRSDPRTAYCFNQCFWSFKLAEFSVLETSSHRGFFL